ncbi:MAG: class I SAM-dependent methyltransferase [Chromatiales bacterium]|nr:class I SAM-dependent methyltransferase [Chromatiales bacterium]
MRAGMRRLMARRLTDEQAGGPEAVFGRFMARIDELRQSPVAIDTDKANEQHYEVPAGFFRQVLGPQLKYSCCYYGPEDRDLEAAEVRMLDMTCERAGLADGQRILELGCGWGSLTLWMASHYPGTEITAVSNSNSQREYILAQARMRGLGNVRVITADVNEFAIAEQFDRVVSVEMFEHMRNYATLLERIAGWLVPGGKLFVHIFCHRSLMYPFTVADESDWMSRWFFTGGLMPAESTLLYFQERLRIESQWRICGTHYQRTAEDWLARMDARRDPVMQELAAAYGADEARLWFNRWRMFFMAVAELFGYAGGGEWFVAHYRFRRD